jgi:hypothetical protein
MAKTSPDLIPGAATGERAHGSLHLWDAIAISVSVIAPGMAMLLWLRAERPDQVAQIGSILGEEGGADAAVLDA